MMVRTPITTPSYWFQTRSIISTRLIMFVLLVLPVNAYTAAIVKRVHQWWTGIELWSLENIAAVSCLTNYLILQYTTSC
jgi:hypothetical protein